MLRLREKEWMGRDSHPQLSGTEPFTAAVALLCRPIRVDAVEQEGIEPSSRVCKTRVFPLDDSPDAARRPLGRRANNETWHARHPIERIAIGPSQRVLSARELTVETSGIEPDPPGLQPGARTNYARFP